MPETPVNEQGYPTAPKDKIGRPGHIPRVQPVTQPGRMERAPNPQFRFRVSTTNQGHLRASRRINIIRLRHSRPRPLQLRPLPRQRGGHRRQGDEHGPA